MSEPGFRLSATVLAAADVGRLASFYEALLGWVRVADEEGWVKLVPRLDGASDRPDPSAVGLSFHHDDQFRAPAWPSTTDEVFSTAHLDLAVGDLTAAVATACSLGATVAEHQPQSGVMVLVDPAGHPFCLFADPDRFAED